MRVRRYSGSRSGCRKTSLPSSTRSPTRPVAWLDPPNFSRKRRASTKWTFSRPSPRAKPQAMSLVLFYHPLASFCWKVLVALYEYGLPFEGRIVDLADEASRAELDRIWPVGKFPVLRDARAGVELPESTIIVEYLDALRAGPTRLLPEDPALLREARLQDRFFDFYVHQPMQKIVADRIRPPDARDPYGVAEARRMLA